MEKKTKLSFEEFEAFQSEREKPVLKVIVIADLFFLAATFILVFIAEEVLKLGILSWPHYWLLFGSNLLVLFSLIFSLVKNLKVWLLKYLLAIFTPLLGIGWIYFTDPKYAKPIFVIAIGMGNLLGFMFYDLKVLLFFNFANAIYLGLLFSHYLRIGAPFALYEISIFYIGLLLLVSMSFPILQRTRMFLTELLQKRRELEEERASLEIKVKARTKELEELTKTLDQKVKERTGELQERISQLERFHKLTIGRELRMAELKKEIEELKEKLEKGEK